MSAGMSYCRTTDGTSIAYTDEGEGPAMLLIAGLSGLSKFWNQPAVALMRSYRVISFDQRGFGASGNAGQSTDAELLANDALSVLDAAGVEQAIVVGHSTGGTNAQTLALDHPERVSHLVLSASWAAADDYMRLLFSLRMELMRTGGTNLYDKLTRLIGYPSRWIGQQGLTFNAHVDDDVHSQSVDEQVLLRIEALLKFDRRDDLQRITQPTLILGTRDDIVIPNYLHVDLAEAIPNAASHFQPYGGHFYPLISPESLTTPLMAWLEQTA